MMTLKFAGVFVATALFGCSCNAVELLTNGDFETGTLSGWVTGSQVGSAGPYGIEVPGTPTIDSAQATATNLSGGSFYAASDAYFDPGSNVLAQTFTISSAPGAVFLNFQMFVNDTSGSAVTNASSLDYTGVPNQHTRVDILTGTAGLFDTGATVLNTLYIGADTGGIPNPYTSYNFDITSTVSTPGTYTLRFASISNQDALITGVDNVSIDVVPEPSSAVFLLCGPVLLLLKRPSRWKS